MLHLLAATAAALLQPGLLSLPRVCRAPLALVRASLSEAESSEVEALLEERDAMRRERDYAAADEIREELRSRFRVIVDDRQKSWWVDDDSSSNGGAAHFRPPAGATHFLLYLSDAAFRGAEHG